MLRADAAFDRTTPDEQGRGDHHQQQENPRLDQHALLWTEPAVNLLRNESFGQPYRPSRFGTATVPVAFARVRRYSVDRIASGQDGKDRATR